MVCLSHLRTECPSFQSLSWRASHIAEGGQVQVRHIVFAAAFVAISSAFPDVALAQSSTATVHQHAHVHGVAKLGVALQDRTLSISLEAPLDSLIGFEHRPNTPEQRRAVDALQATMRAPGRLFRPNPAAACTLIKGQAESAIFQPAVPGATEEHADLDASFEFDCAHPDKLTTLDLGLFEAYPKLRLLDVDVATEKGQFKRDLRSPQHSVPLSRKAS